MNCQRPTTNGQRLLSIKLLTTILLLATSVAAQSYIGFDRNEYPGDNNLKALHQTFSYTGYWLNNPPGMKTNNWRGHRAGVESAGFGFLVLFNGRLYADLKTTANATRMGKSDALAATTTAQREGFPRGTIIFLDQEQGGRMLDEQKTYLYAWVDAVIAAGFRAGIYCSGMPNPEDENVITAEDIRANAGKREITYWVTNDSCPPSPGCATPAHAPGPAQSGIRFAEIWQYAQSPRRSDVAAHCTNYARDANCYPPGIPASQNMHIDLSTANSPDPSHGRSQK